MNTASIRNIIELVRLELRKPLPGKTSHRKMIPSTGRPLNQVISYQRGSILILLYPDDDKLNTVFIKRVMDNTPHGGQISFPGGIFESGDKSLRETALRETEEELGVIASEIEIIGQLTPLQVQVSNIEVTPFIGVIYRKPHFKPSPEEVDYLIEVKLVDLLNPDIIQKKVVVNNENRIEIPFYNIRDNHIWGATAMILTEFLDVLRNIDIHNHL